MERKARIWNFSTQIYEDYTLPDGAKLISNDMDEIIQCAACGKELPFGDTYTSRIIHTEHGLGYCVCQECYNREISEELAWRNYRIYGGREEAKEILHEDI